LLGGAHLVQGREFVRVQDVVLVGVEGGEHVGAPFGRFGKRHLSVAVEIPVVHEVSDEGGIACSEGRRDTEGGESGGEESPVHGGLLWFNAYARGISPIPSVKRSGHDCPAQALRKNAVVTRAAA